MTARRLHWLLLPALALVLSGCVGGLLGGGKPDRLYRFGASQTALEAPGPVAGPLYRVRLPTPTFPAEVADQRILTVEQAQASYIKGARWVSAAPMLYGAALAAALRRQEAGIEIVDKRRPDADHLLYVRIQRFEARYDKGAKEPPVIQVEGEASLFDKDGKQVAAWLLADQEPAVENRMGAIVAAFDRAVARQSAVLARWAVTALKCSERCG
ncbi:ABC-type transport auxiliary lipoprotein family protein [Sphingobium sp. DC-2]|uniref:ABC-type transport auxiliary lipoprotein family protein n=1 Tax=Sphingobium sp. DC-2 TaxID=1303256 RepID=UPI0004C3E748|nr:ABC-type transport auxiliary lipoprotein family protein [Sphingobium sp. DC-2]